MLKTRTQPIISKQCTGNNSQLVLMFRLDLEVWKLFGCWKLAIGFKNHRICLYTYRDPRSDGRILSTPRTGMAVPLCRRDPYILGYRSSALGPHRGTGGGVAPPPSTIRRPLDNCTNVPKFFFISETKYVSRTGGGPKNNENI